MFHVTCILSLQQNFRLLRASTLCSVSLLFPGTLVVRIAGDMAGPLTLFINWSRKSQIQRRVSFIWLANSSWLTDNRFLESQVKKDSEDVWPPQEEYCGWWVMSAKTTRVVVPMLCSLPGSESPHLEALCYVKINTLFKPSVIDFSYMKLKTSYIISYSPTQNFNRHLFFDS